MDERAPAHPQVVEGMRRGLAIPPAGGFPRIRSLEVGVGERAALLDRLLDGSHRALVVLRPEGPVPIARPIRIAVHHPAPAREMVGRHQAGGMRPVLEEQAAPVDETIERLLVVGTEAAPQRQVMRAVNDVDRVELDAARVGGERQQGARGEPAGPRAGEVLAFEKERRGGAERDPDGRGALRRRAASHQAKSRICSTSASKRGEARSRSKRGLTPR